MARLEEGEVVGVAAVAEEVLRLLCRTTRSSHRMLNMVRFRQDERMTRMQTIVGGPEYLLEGWVRRGTLEILMSHCRIC